MGPPTDGAKTMTESKLVTGHEAEMAAHEQAAKEWEAMTPTEREAHAQRVRDDNLARYGDDSHLADALFDTDGSLRKD